MSRIPIHLTAVLAAAACLASSTAMYAQNESEQYLCWKKNFGRGAGAIPTDCPAGKQKDAGLCYPACPAGMTGVGPVCWSGCPTGFRDDGAFCAKPAAYGRGAGYAIWDESKCRAENGGNCEKNGALWYPTCKAGFSPAGCCICSPVCPGGMTDIGVSCAKKTETRGVGTIPNCGSGLANDAGLCYPSCPRDFDGVGPVCWSKCPADFPFACGAGCAKSQTACAAAVTDMTLQTVSVLANIATTALGAPGVTEAAKAGLKAGMQSVSRLAVQGSFKTAESMVIGSTKGLAKEFAWTFVKTMAKNQLDPRNAFSNAYMFGKFATLQGLNAAANESGVVKQSGQFDYTLFMVADPTGISSMVYAFAKYGSCSVDDIAPNVKTVDFGAGPAAPTDTRTIEIAVQSPTTITEITTSSMKGCAIQPVSDCVGKALQSGQKCNVKVNVTGTGRINGELRIYTTAYNAFPLAIPVKANSSAASECGPGAGLEAVNLTSVTGAWAWNDDQARKVIISSDGTVQSWRGAGRITLVDPAARTYNLVTGGTSETISLKDDHDHLTINGGTATRRPWDSRCDAGLTFWGGLCWDVPVGYEMTAAGVMGKVCPVGWRDDGISCYPNWTGPKVAYQADMDGTLPMQRPILVTNCSLSSCPANFQKDACTCRAIPKSKELKSIASKPAH